MGAREEILGHCRRAAPASETSAWPPPSRAIAAPAAPARIARFVAAANSAAATVARVTAARDVAEAVARYLESEGIRPGVHLGADPPGLGPGQAGRLQCETRALRPDGDTLVTSCFAALADEGAIVMASGPAHAPETSFLAATHVVVLRAGQLVDSMAALWPLLRSSGQPLPRMVNIIRGPSRTADLGVPSRLGAHGPLRVHVILIDDTASAPANV